MAAVLDALVPFVKKLIKDMAQEEVPMLPGISGEITRLESNMESIQAFAADAERRRITDNSVKRWASKFRDAMYDATDILDFCQLEADKRSKPKDSILEEKVSGCFQPLFFCLRNPMFTHDIGSRIKALNQQLEDIHKEADKYKFNVKLGLTPEPRMLELSRSNRSESDIVGEQIERDAKELALVLTTTHHSDIKVVSIVGVGGIGKTTLAHKIFNESIIQEHFSTRIWLSITQQFGVSELLRSAITQACGDHGGEHNKSILTDTLIHILSAGRFLLVMDDVWSNQAWHNVLSIPVRIAMKKQAGSWVIVTTRMGHIAQLMGASFYQHHVRPLGTEDAWSLLKKQLPPDQVLRIETLKDIGMKILAKCDGLPLAIKVVGGLLSTRYLRRHEWESVLNMPAWSLTAGLPRELDNHRLYLCYEDLSPQLKQCFLYCSLFPKGQKIIQGSVTKMWVSEGFIQPPDENSTTSSHQHELEDIAIGNYLELVKRNLIEPISSTGYMCTMHDVVRSFAEYMAHEEAALVVQQEVESFGGHSKLLRRLSIDSTMSVPLEWAALQKLVSLRVLIINCKSNFRLGDSLGSFSSLRVLHIVRLSDSDMLVSSLCQLKHLRYLYLYVSDISRLPDDIDRMKFLLYIGLVHCERFVQLPGNVIKLRQLRSLDLVGSKVLAVPRGFGSLTNLRSLFGFPVYKDSGGQDWCSLEELAPLSQLRSLRLEGLEKVDASHLAPKDLISSKQHLSYLQLNYSGSTTRSSSVSNLEEQQQQLIQEEVYEHLTPPPCLETLLMEGYIGRRLPIWMWAPNAADYKSMRYLSLHNLASCTLLPDGLCQMRSLERLEINKAPLIRLVGPEFLHHRGLGYAFPRLQELVLYDLVDWSEWEWYDDVQAMPALEVLLVKSCKLWHLPPGLSYHASSLRRLVITGARLLESLENFPSLVELEICIGTELFRISGLPMLQKLTVKICPKLEVLEGMPALDSLVVEDYRMETLPDYLPCISPRYLKLYCTRKLRESILEPGGSEWLKISHIKHTQVYAEDGGYPRKMEAMLDSEDTGSDIPSGSAVKPVADDDLVGSDIPSGQTEVDSELVGVEKPREEIIKMLMRGQDTGKKQLQVVSICGIGGSGKTCIANAIYKQIRYQFECCAFVLESPRHADNKGIIEDIFDQVGCPCPSFEEDVISQQPIEQLIAQLKKFLQDKRYLIVLDNIWELSVWEMIKPALVGNNQGSGIITTTYKVVVAESIGGVYRLPLLSNEDSKILFYRRTYFGSEDDCPFEYRDLTKRALNKCGQLPLAIMTITSLLPNNRLNSKEEWRNVCNSIGSGSELGYRVKDMRKRLSRGYYDLPPHLRTCFLYLFIFPEDYVIRRDTLVQRWLSEDLICGDREQNLHELGESYFYHLLDTGLIQPIEHDDDGRPLACRVPGVMIDLIATLVDEEKCSLEKEIKEKCALQKENEKNFAHGEETEEKHDALRKEIETLKKEIEEKHATTPAGRNKVKRLSIQISEQKHTVAKATKPLGEADGKTLSKGKPFRKGSLSISCSADSMAAIPIYKNLSVLVLEGSLENRHIVKYLGSLNQLTCLILASTQITLIPKKVGNLRFLQTLDLRATSVHQLPSTFVQLKQLRCLLINRSTKVSAGISNLQALEELQDISTTPDILEGICALPELRFLRIALWSWDESSSKPLPETLCKLSTTKLKHLSICTSCSLEFMPDDIQEVLQNIEKLEIQHSTFGTLPTWIDGILQKLSSLSIEVYSLKMKALETLASLPALHFLSLTIKGGTEEMPTANTTTQDGRGKKAQEENPTAKKSTEEAKPNSNRAPEKRPTAQRTPDKKTTEEIRPDAKTTPKKGPTAQSAPAKLVAPKGFRKLKTFHMSSRAIGIKFQQGSMENLERLKLSFQASSLPTDSAVREPTALGTPPSSLPTDDFSFGLENLSSLKQVQVEIICFSATEKVVKKAEDAIRDMIWDNPRLPRPALDIRRSAEEYMIEDKREFREELRDKIIASWDARTSSAHKGKQKQKNA